MSLKSCYSEMCESRFRRMLSPVDSRIFGRQGQPKWDSLVECLPLPREKVSAPQKENAMKTIRAMLSILLLLASTAPARADFKYTETSQVTGGALIKMVKLATVFARGDAKKQEQQALQPTSTTHYLKGNRLRTDRADGTAQIIDLDGRRVVAIDTNNKTYAVATFEQIKAAMEQAQQKMQQQVQQNSEESPQQKQQMQDTQVKITPTVQVTPGTGSKVILDQPTNEIKVQMDMAMQATATGSNAPPSGQPSSATVTYSMNMDTFVAPGVTGYLEFGQFYRRMAQEVNWMTLPSNVQIDPRVTQGLSSLQQNSDALKGFPLLSYVNMTMAAADGQPQPGVSQNSAPSQSQSNSPASTTTNPSSDGGIPDSASAAVVKGLGSLFGKKKQQDNPSKQGASSSQTSTPPPNPNSDPNSLIEITTQVNSFSDSSLDGRLFDVPEGYTQVQQDPAQVFGGKQQSPPATK
jgi:hypothetical protein